MSLVEGSFERRCRERGRTMLPVKEGEQVLSIGFGTGQSVVAFARAVGSSGKVCGLDLSEGMCREAEKRVRHAQVAPRVELVCGDALFLPFASDCFDVVSMSFVLELFDTDEIPLVLRECQRVRASRRAHWGSVARQGEQWLDGTDL